MPFGFFDTTYIDFPANIDQTYVAGLRTQAGVDFPQILREIDSRLGALNTNLDPLIAQLITPTTEAVIDDTAPTAFVVDERGEYTVARPQLTDEAGHMLPLRGYDVSVGFTEDGLERMPLGRIINNIEGLLLGFRMLYRKQVLKRLFSAAEVRVEPKTTAVSPGFAGSGTGLNVFSRPYPDGTSLPGGYTHYYAANTSNAGELKTVIKAARDRLRKWMSGPFDLTANEAMTALITAMTSTDPLDGFVAAGSPLVRVGTGANEANVDPTEFLGVLFGDIRVRHPINDTASPNIALYKSAGSLNPMNPLAWRYDPAKGRNAVLRYRSFYPLDQAVVKQDFGIGVNNRVAVALIYAAAGAASYNAPTDL